MEAKGPWRSEFAEFSRDSAAVVFAAMRVLRDLGIGFLLVGASSWVHAYQARSHPALVVVVMLWILDATSLLYCLRLLVRDVKRFRAEWRGSATASDIALIDLDADPEAFE